MSNLLKSSRKYLKFLIWPGLAAIAAGWVAGFMGGWTPLPVALLIGGGVLCVVAIALGGYGIGAFLQSRSTQAGTNALVATLSMLLILGLVNFLGVRYDQRIDLTEAQLFTLAPESQTVVANLDQPVEVVVFSDGVPNPTDQRLLENYRRFNSDFNYEYVNPITNPGRASDFGARAFGEVYLQAGDRRILVQRISQQERLSEQDLTNRLDQLGRDHDAVVYFLQGHGEYTIDGSQPGLFEAASALENDNFTIETLNLADTASVPSDAAVVVIAAPELRQFQPLFDAERAAIEQYLNAGGSVLLMIDPQVTTGLEPLLDTWGVVLDNRLIVDVSGGGQLVGQGEAAPLVTDYGDHPITAEFDNGRSFYPLARPVQINAIEGVEATPLMLTHPLTYAEPINEDGQIEIDTEQPPGGPYNIGVAFSRAVVDQANQQVSNNQAGNDQASNNLEAAPETDASPEASAANPTAATEAQPPGTAATATEAPETEDPEIEGDEAEGPDESITQADEARLVVIGNVGFATDGRFSQQLNGDVFLNSVSWLSQIDTPTLSIRPKEAVNRRILMTVQQQIVVVVLALLVLPVIGVIGAGVMWARQR